MTLLSLLLVLIVIGVVLWAVITYIPMPPAIKNIILVVGVIVAIIYVLSAFGVISGITNIKVPSVK